MPTRVYWHIIDEQMANNRVDMVRKMVKSCGFATDPFLEKLNKMEVSNDNKGDRSYEKGSTHR